MLTGGPEESPVKVIVHADGEYENDLGMHFAMDDGLGPTLSTLLRVCEQLRTNTYASDDCLYDFGINR